MFFSNKNDVNEIMRFLNEFDSYMDNELNDKCYNTKLGECNRRK